MSYYQRGNEEDKIIEKWHTSKLELADFLQTYGLLDGVPDVDWSAQRIKWEKDEIVVTARIKQLCRYSPYHKLLTIPIANNFNGSFVPTSPEYSEESDENGAWLCAINIAKAEKAQYVYRLRQPHVVLFVGLWQLQVTNPSNGITLAASTRNEYLLELVQQLRLVLQQKHQDAASVSRFFNNYAEAMLRHAQNSYEEKYQQRVQQIGKRLKTISKSFAPRFGFFSPFLRSPLSEGKIEQLKNELTSIEAGILSN